MMYLTSGIAQSTEQYTYITILASIILLTSGIILTNDDILTVDIIILLIL